MRDPFVEANAIETLYLQDGKCVMRMPVKDSDLNPYGIIHGGVLYALADTAAGYAAASGGILYVTADASMQYLRPGRDTAYIEAAAETIKQGKTIAFVRTSVQDENGTELCAGTFTHCSVRKKGAVTVSE